MNYLSKKKKVILGILISIIIIGICYYRYLKEMDLFTKQEENLEIEKNELKDVKEKNEENLNEFYEDTDKIIVHVSGAVKQEGVVELKNNSRIADAIEKAGGLREDACMEEINLAYILEDGMKIHIPTIEEQKKNNNNQTDNNFYGIVSNGEQMEKEEGKSTIQEQNSKVNINTATKTELETLPGIGESTALKIINYRNEKGKFKSIEDIKNVSGIGESKFKNIKNLISV